MLQVDSIYICIHKNRNIFVSVFASVCVCVSVGCALNALILHDIYREAILV